MQCVTYRSVGTGVLEFWWLHKAYVHLAVQVLFVEFPEHLLRLSRLTFSPTVFYCYVTKSVYLICTVPEPELKNTIKATNVEGQGSKEMNFNK
jgi:hypothetical protein